MRFLQRLILVGLGGVTLLAGAATVSKLGAQSLEHPRGVSLREESVRDTHRRGFFYVYGSRYHRGGGPGYGK